MRGIGSLINCFIRFVQAAGNFCAGLLAILATLALLLHLLYLAGVISFQIALP